MTIWLNWTYWKSTSQKLWNLSNLTSCHTILVWNENVKENENGAKILRFWTKWNLILRDKVMVKSWKNRHLFYCSAIGVLNFVKNESSLKLVTPWISLNYNDLESVKKGQTQTFGRKAQLQVYSQNRNMVWNYNLDTWCRRRIWWKLTTLMLKGRHYDKSSDFAKHFNIWD